MYKDATPLTKMFKTFLYILIAFLFFEIFVEILYLSKLHQAFSVFPTYSAIKELSAETEPIKNLVHSIDIIETIRSILLGGSIIFSIFSFILYCLWIYRINCNTKELGALNSKFKPSVAIWSMLVPIYNLIGPFLAVKKTWQANIIPLNQQKRKVPALFYYWWILVILAIICHCCNSLNYPTSYILIG